MSLRDAILGAQDLKTSDVEVPEWGVTVRVRMLTGTERDTMNEAGSPGGKFDQTSFVAALLVRCILDPETGERIFADDEGALLSQKSAAARARIFEVAAKLNGLYPGATEDAEKNSSAAPSGDSPSA